MRLIDLVLLGDAVEKIHERTETYIPDIIKALTGIAWDEKDADQIKSYNEYDENICGSEVPSYENICGSDILSDAIKTKCFYSGKTLLQWDFTCLGEEARQSRQMPEEVIDQILAWRDNERRRRERPDGGGGSGIPCWT